MANLPLTIPDLRCTDDMDPFAAETASDLETLEQDVLHVLMESPGENIDDPDRGIGVLDMLSAAAILVPGATAAAGNVVNLSSIPDLIDTGLRKDDRIDTSTTTLTQTTEPQSFADGSVLPVGSFLLEIEIQVGAATLGLSYAFTPTGGLQTFP